MNINDTPSMGQITAADLENAIAAGSTGRILHMQTMLPHGLDAQGRYETRRWGQARSDEQQWVAGIEKTKPQAPRVVPCSTFARLYLALRRWWRG